MKKKNSLMTVVAFFAITTITLAQVPTYVPTSGLVGWWPFTGNAIDSSGNGHNGTVTGATLVSDRFGNFSSAYFFNYSHWSWGSGGDEIYIPHTSTLAPTNLTVSVWAYRTSAGYPNQGLTIINRYEQGYNNPNGQTWGIGTPADPNTTIQTFVLQAAPNNSQAGLGNIGQNLGLNTLLL